MKRLTQLQARLIGDNIPGLLITDAVNVSYLTGFTGDESALLVTPQAVFFVTDSRYVEQFHQEVTQATLVLHQDGLYKACGRQADQLGLTHLGFEAVHLSYADYRQLDQATKATLVPTTDVVERLREVKEDSELAAITRAIAIAEAGYDHVLATIKPGMREVDIATDLDFYMRQLGAQGVSFETIVASGTRSAMPHGSATTKVLETGDVITLDWGCIVDGYVSDLTRTFALGRPDPRLAELYRIVYAANQAVQEALRPGVTGRQINAIAHDFIDDAGYGRYFGHGTGHGIGRSIHEGPGAWGPYLDVPHVAANVVTDEPGIYVPDLGGIRIEDDLLVTANGNRSLSRPAPQELLTIA